MRDHKDCARVCRVLAAQIAEVQARFACSSDALIATLGKLDLLLSAQSGAAAGGGAAAAAESDALQAALDSLLFVQAQEHDVIRQMMGTVGKALALMPDRLDVEGLAGLYVSDVQRHVHDVVLDRGDVA